jgi:hypothetical protein
LNCLLDDLVLLAKIEAWALRLKPEPIALHTVIEQAIDQLPPDQRGDFSIKGSDTYVTADTPYLRHALVLLLHHLRDDATTQTLVWLEATTIRRLDVIDMPTPDHIAGLQSRREAAHIALDQFHHALEIQRQEAP